MRTDNKKGIRWWIFQKFGPPEVKNLIGYIDHIWEQLDTDNICIYPAGEFLFQAKTSNNDDLEPIIFPTPQERQAFQNGMTYGVEIMGGTSAALDEEQFEALENMEKKSTHGGGGSRNN